MKDKRNEILARTLVDYSTQLKKGDFLYLEIKGKDTLELGKHVLRLATEKGATTFWFYNDESMLRQWLLSATEAQIKALAAVHLDIMKRSQAYIGMRGSDNPFDLADIPPKTLDAWNKHFVGPVHIQQRVKHTRWVVLRYPNNAMAQLAKMSQEAFEDYYYEVCCADYARMDKAEDKLVKLMRAADKVHIKGPGTDLRFSIKGIPAVKCSGRRNIPDGEVYTAPVKDSVEGAVRINTPSLHQGIVYNNIVLTFQKGRIVKAAADNDVEKLNKVFDTDAGARYVGEFSLGVNPFVTKAMMDTLFDEKIAGSFHFTPGACYEEAWNGNESSIHWDLVVAQRPELGGGEIWFDGKLIRKDGVFTDASLERLFSKRNLKSAALG